MAITFPSTPMAFIIGDSDGDVQPNSLLQGGLFSNKTTGVLSQNVGPAAAPRLQPMAAVVAASPDRTTVSGTNGSIIDALGNVWAINAAKQVTFNGAPDTTTANVVELAWASGVIWQKNSSNLWWGKSSPAAQWSPGNGTATSPV